MFLTRCWSVLLFAGVGLSSVLGQTAGDKALPPAPDFSKEAYVVERLYSRIKVENDGTNTREVTAEVKVLADAGVKAFAVLNFTYTSANEVVEIDYVRVRRPDGTVVKTPDYNIQDMPGEVTRSAPLYSDIHEKHVAVKGLGVGDTLEYLVRYRVTKPEVPGHFWFEASFTKDAIAKDERLELSLPGAKYVKIVSPDYKPEVTDEGGQKIYRWKHSNLILKEKEPREIPRRIPPNPDIQITTFSSWEEIGRWYADLQKEPLQITPAIQAKAAELTKGLKTDDEKIEATYRFVALKFHYIGLDFGIGRYQPHAADDILDNGYGDCKDKHTLLAALLKAEGIDASPVLIHATRKLDPEVPSPAQFNHVITAVSRGDQLIWLDTTPEVAPYRLLLLGLRGKQALLIPANKPAVLVTTPANPPTAGHQSFAMEGKLSAEGVFTGHAEQSYSGDLEVVLRAVFRQVPQSKWKEAVQRFSYGLNFMGDVSNVAMTQPDDMSRPFTLSYDYERKNYGDWDNHQVPPPMPPMGIEMSKDTKKPHESVQLGALGDVVYRAKIALPPGYSATAPTNVDLDRAFAEYHASYSIESNVLTANRRFVTKKNEVPLGVWEDFRDFGKAISDDENHMIYLSGGGKGGSDTKTSGDLAEKFGDAQEAMRKGDRSRGQELFEQIIKADPKYPLAHLNLGTLLMMENKTTEAIAEWHKEQEINPGDVRVFQVPATYLTYMNRRDEAIVEWRKLLKVDAKNHDAALQLSGLLMAEGKNSEAIAVLEDAVKATPDSSSLNKALGGAYLQDNQMDKGIPYLEKTLRDEKEIDPGTLNDAAYMLADKNSHLDLAKEYAEKAVAELDRRSAEAAKNNDPDGFVLAAAYAATWDTVGWVYFQAGDFTRAEDYLHAAWTLGQGGDAGDHLGQAYEKLGKKKEAEHIYIQALSAQYVPAVSAPAQFANQSEVYKKTRNSILAHYEKLTGRKQPPPVAINRLPNGQWTKTPSDELLDKRRAHVTKSSHLTGSCDFEMIFAPGKVESVHYLSGTTELKDVGDQLQETKFETLFPAGSGARIFRRVTVTCSSTSGCNAEMVPPNQGIVMSRRKSVQMTDD